MNKYIVIIIGLWAFLFSGCSGEEEDDLIDLLEKEKVAIHDYLSRNVTSGEVLAIPYYSRKGMLIDSIFIFNYNGAGEVAKDSGWVWMNYDLMHLDGSILDSSDREKWSDGSFIPAYLCGGPVLHRVDTARLNFLAEAFRHISVGEYGGEVIIPSIFGSKDGQALRYKLVSHKVFDDVIVNEREMMQSYMSGLRPVETFEDYPGEVQSDTVAYTLLLEKGAGTRNLQTGDSVLLEMSYGIVDDVALQTRFFRSVGVSDTTKVLFNDRWQRNYPAAVVKGLQHLQQGDSAHILVPFSMAYGVRGTTQTIRDSKVSPYIIPPLATMWYWVRIKEIKHLEEETPTE